MPSLGPIFRAELSRVASRRRWYVLRSASGLLLILLFWFAYDGWIRRGHYSVGGMPGYMFQMLCRALCFGIAFGQVVLVILLAPSIAAGAIAEERGRKTLHYLLSSRLTSPEIVGGKVASRFVMATIPIALSLPVVVLVGAFGGVDWRDVLRIYLGTLGTALALVAISVLASTVARRGGEALLLANFAAFGWLLGPSLLKEVMTASEDPWPGRYTRWIDPVNRHIIGSTPFHAFANDSANRVRGGPFEPHPGRIEEMLAYQAGAVAGVVLLASLLLRPASRFIEGGRPGRRGKVSGRDWGRLIADALLRLRIRPRPGPEDDPMLWKETVASRSRSLATLCAGGVAVVAFATAFPYLRDTLPLAWSEWLQHGYGVGRDPGRAELNDALRFVVTTLFVGGMLVLAAEGAASISREREEDTWIPLVSTPLDGREILRAKLIGSAWSCRWLAAAILGSIGVGVLLGGVHPYGALLDIGLIAAFGVVILASSTLASIASRTTVRAVTLALGLFAAVSMIAPMALVLVYGDGRVQGMMSPPFLVAIGLVSYDDVFAGGTRGMPNRLPLDFWTTFGMPIIAGLSYLLVGIILLNLTYRRFDRLLDRPRRSGSIVIPPPA